MIDGYATETRTGEHGPVVVRTAATETARQLLAQEGDRLDRSRHPGVVKLLAASADELTIAWAGAQTLELLAAPIPVLCGVLTSVASTVADLHGIGIIHGRLDASHVVIDADGRPRLCGMRGPSVDERTPLPTDDVAAIGALIDHLMGCETELEPIPERRWSRRRWTGYQRRALQLVADRASHEDPARRPTARELATAIAEAVPDAQLMPPPRRADSRKPQDLENPPPPDDQATRSDHQEEMAPLLAPEPAHQAARAARPNPPSPPPPPPPAVPPAVEVSAPQPAEPPIPRPVGALPTTPPPTNLLGLRIEPPEPSSDDRGTKIDPERRAQRRDDSARQAPPWRTSRRTAPLLVAAAATVVGLLVWGVGFRSSPAPVDRGASPPPIPASNPPLPSAPAMANQAAPTSTRCPSTSPTTGPDLDGDGCPDLVEIDGTRVTVAGVRFEVGEQGDRVEVADWNCDGRPTAATVRPGTGEIFVFSRWVADDEPVTVTPTTVVPGAVSLVKPDDGPCNTHHRVRVVGGSTVPVDLPARQP